MFLNFKGPVGFSGTRGFKVRVRVSSGLAISYSFGFGFNRVQEKRPKPVGFSGSGKPDHALVNSTLCSVINSFHSFIFLCVVHFLSLSKINDGQLSPRSIYLKTFLTPSDILKTFLSKSKTGRALLLSPLCASRSNNLDCNGSTLDQINWWIPDRSIF